MRLFKNYSWFQVLKNTKAENKQQQFFDWLTEFFRHHNWWSTAEEFLFQHVSTICPSPVGFCHFPVDIRAYRVCIHVTHAWTCRYVGDAKSATICTSSTYYLLVHNSLYISFPVHSLHFPIHTKQHGIKADYPSLVKWFRTQIFRHFLHFYR